MIKQEEIPLYKKQKLCKGVGTLKATITYSESHLKKEVVAVSLHDKKPIYLMRSITESISWTKKTKKV